MLELIEEGSLQPTAEQVADFTGLGIRTVFRHLSDSERLFAAINARVSAEAAPLLQAARPEGDLRERVKMLVRVRSRFFERVAVYKRAGALKRWRSPFLRGRHGALVKELRMDLLRWLPELEGESSNLIDALDLLTSFEAWDRLRTEQGLGQKRALATIERSVLALVGEFAPA